MILYFPFLYMEWYFFFGLYGSIRFHHMGGDNKMFRRDKIVLFITIVSLMGAIRFFENILFYDPFLNYFKSGYYRFPFPEFNDLQLGLSFFCRYFINSVLSLALLFVLFKDKAQVRFSAFLFLFLFLFLIVGFFIVVYHFENNKMILFYIRRFIIQPVFVLLFIPGFYYQNRNRTRSTIVE